MVTSLRQRHTESLIVIRFVATYTARVHAPTTGIIVVTTYLLRTDHADTLVALIALITVALVAVIASRNGFALRTGTLPAIIASRNEFALITDTLVAVMASRNEFALITGTLVAVIASRNEFALITGSLVAVMASRDMHTVKAKLQAALIASTTLCTRSSTANGAGVKVVVLRALLAVEQQTILAQSQRFTNTALADRFRTSATAVIGYTGKEPRPRPVPLVLPSENYSCILMAAEKQGNYTTRTFVKLGGNINDPPLTDGFHTVT